MCFNFQLYEPFSPRSNLFHHFSKLCPDARRWSFLTLLAYSTTFRNPFLIYCPNLFLTNKYKYDNTSRSDSVSLKRGPCNHYAVNPEKMKQSHQNRVRVINEKVLSVLKLIPHVGWLCCSISVSNCSWLDLTIQCKISWLNVCGFSSITMGYRVLLF